MLHIIKREDRVWPIATGMYPAISLMNANLVPVGKKLTNLNCEVGSAYVAFHATGRAAPAELEASSATTSATTSARTAIAGCGLRSGR